MSKRIVMSLICSLVASIVCTVGSFSCKDKDADSITLVVEHPDGCFLLEPSPLAAGVSSSADMVSVKPGIVTFKMDCDGKQVEVKKEVKDGQFSVEVKP